MLATATPPADLRPGGSTLDKLVTDIIDLGTEGGATRQRLLERGWDTATLDAELSEALTQAALKSVRQLRDTPVRTDVDIERDLVALFHELLPTRQLLATEAQARGFTKPELDRLFDKAIYRAITILHPARR